MEKRLACKDRLAFLLNQKTKHLALLGRISGLMIFPSLVSAAEPGPAYHMPTDRIVAEQRAKDAEEHEAAVNAPRPYGSRKSLMNLDMFRLVNTVVIANSFGPKTSELLGISHREYAPAVLNAVERVFSEASSRFPVKEVSIKPIVDPYLMEQGNLHKRNVIIVDFILSARQDGEVKVAVLSLKIENPSRGVTFANGIAYPFIVPKTDDEFLARIQKGVFYLVSTLPDHIACANKYGNPSTDCPDCSLSNCHLSEPYLDSP